MKLLLNRDDVATDSRDKYGWTPLSWAAEEGHETIVKLLLSRDDVAISHHMSGQIARTLVASLTAQHRSKLQPC